MLIDGEVKKTITNKHTTRALKRKRLLSWVRR
jgi:hypothetical protein